MITKRLLTILTLLFSVSTISYSQTWTQVWADEFNTIGPDWVFEIGTGSGGWGNNELQYYRRENAAIVNGQLEITARREAFGGMNYTSSRMKTQGRKSWKYGRIEARMSMPSFQGVWPAFWMLGDNITSVGWPACGEIDIMEHVNTGGQVFGTIHWSDQNNVYAQYGGNTTTSITSMHTYAVEWNATSIKWFVDGVQFHIVDIANGINGTSEFHNNFFILLNMAIGGNWPGFTIDNNAFPAKMIVDYVRVFQAGTPPSGVATVYKDCNFAGTAVSLPVGNYTMAQLNSRGILNDDISSLRVNSGYEIVIYQNDNFTGSAFTFTAEDACLVDNGINDYATSLRVRARTGSFSQTIQSESYSTMLGVQTETTTDAGGGQNVGWIETGDWMSYAGVNIPTAGSYLVEYRVASPTGGNISLDINGGATVLGSVAVPATGGWQSWRTISHIVNLPTGTHAFGVYALTGGFNINWFRISTAPAAALRSGTTEAKVTQVNVFPTTVVNELNVETPEELSNASIKIVNAQGVVKYSGTLCGQKVNVAGLNQGIYSIIISKDGNKVIKKFIKE